MHITYNSKFDDEDFEVKDCKYLTGYTDKEIFHLTGIYSVINFNQLLIDQIKIVGRYPVCILIVNTVFVRAALRLNIKTGKILITQMIVTPAKTGIGIKLFCSMLQSAHSMGFLIFKLVALKSNSHNGYITFARYGFTMTDIYRIQFEKLINGMGYKIMDLFSFLIIDKQTWEKKGFSWEGEFELKILSTNRMLIIKYIQSRIKDSRWEQERILKILEDTNIDLSKNVFRRKTLKKVLQAERRLENNLLSGINFLEQ